MRKFLILSALAALTLVTGCQTHDRAAYRYETAPVRDSSVKLENRTTPDTAGTLPPEPGQTGLESPALIP